MIRLERCKKIFIDFDGVIVDSNSFKELAIEKSIIKTIGNRKNTQQAIDFFNKNAGVSREKKLLAFFKKHQVSEILKMYSRECKSFFKKENPTKGFISFLDYLKFNFKETEIFILSGGEEEEIISFLKRNLLDQYFTEILASKKSKIEHLEERKVSENDIFIGDSRHDLESSIKVGLKFILFEDFKSIQSFPSKKLIEDHVYLKTNNFESLLNKLSS